MNIGHGDRIGAGFLRSSCRLGKKLVLVALGPLLLGTMVAAQSPDATTMIRRSQQALRGRTEQGEVLRGISAADLLKGETALPIETN